VGKPSRFRLFRVRSPLLTESIFLSFPPVTEMFQFTGLAARHLWIQCLLIRVSRDQRLLDSYPELFAVFHALHRLLTPRHPPCALSSLTTTIQNSPHPPADSRRQDSHRISDVRQPLHTCHQLQGLRLKADGMIQSNDSSFVSPSSWAPCGASDLDKRYLRNRAKSRLTPGPKPAGKRHLSRRCHLLQQPNCQRSSIAIWLSQMTIAHWVGAIFARQNWLATSASVRPSGKKQEYENRPEVSMRGPSDSLRG
jgi:hypothetical protein